MGIGHLGLPDDGLSAAAVCVAARVPADSGDDVLRTARRFGLAAAELRAVSSALGAVVRSTSGPVWSGAGQRAFVDAVQSGLPGVIAATARYESYAGALSGYGQQLAVIGPRLRLLQQHIQDRLPVGTVTVPVASRGAADADLLSRAREFRSAHDQWADAVDVCIAALRRADHADPLRDAHGWRALAHDVGRVASELDPVGSFLLHPSWANLSHCLGVLGSELTVLGVALLFVFPPAGMACLTAATVVSGLQTATDIERRHRGEHVAASTIGLDAVGAIPMIGRGGKVVQEIVKSAEEFGPDVKVLTRTVPGTLAAHEGAQRGHTLARHVDKSFAFLKNRIVAEGLPEASCFYSRAVAEESISDLLVKERSKIEAWKNEDPRKAKKVLKLMCATTDPLGGVLVEGSAVLDPGRGLKVILKRDRTSDLGYFILTAMVTS